MIWGLGMGQAQRVSDALAYIVQVHSDFYTTYLPAVSRQHTLALFAGQPSSVA